MPYSSARLLLRLAAVAGLAIPGAPALASQSTAPVEISSFSGAYLAARVAEVDNDLDGAIAYYRRALGFDPQNQELQQNLMLALISSGRFDEALPYAEKLKAVAEIERFSRLALAVDSFRKKDYKAAESWLKIVLESDVDGLVSKVLTAWAKAGGGDGAGALALLDKLTGPEWYGLFLSYHKGLIADTAGLKAEAERYYQAALDDVAAGSATPETWLHSAEAYAGFLARSGKKDAALAVLDKTEQFATGRMSVAMLRDRINGNQPLKPMIGSPADGASELLLDLSTALNRGGGESFVRLYLQYALALKPTSDEVLIQLAAVAEQQQDAEGAIALYGRIPADSPLKRAAELQLGLNLADLDRHDEGIKHLGKLLEQDPDDMRAYLALGGVHASREDYRSAADTYDKAVARLEAAPAKGPAAANWNVYYQRGIAYERLKQWPKAEPNFKKALELFPNQPQVMNYLGYSWIDMNMHLEEGLELIKKAVDLRPSDGYIVDSLGWANYRLGRYEEAVRDLERAVSLKPDDPVLNDHLGDAYWRVGRRLEATFQWSHARDMKPDPDVLAGVEKKLAHGLPPIDAKTAETPEKPAPLPVEPPRTHAPVSPATPEKRTEAAREKLLGTAVPAVYKVRSGQSLWSIAVDQLGAGPRYLEIIDLNPELQSNPGMLMPGQELMLP